MKRTPLKRRTRLSPIGAKARREREAVREFRAAVMVRSRGRCEVRTPACERGDHLGSHAHHIWPSDRDRGVHDPERGLYCCANGHAWIHREPNAARLAGWLMRDGDEREDVA